MLRKIAVLLLVMGTVCSCINKTTEETGRKTPLSHWQFKYDSLWYDANIPGCVHTDLLANGIISDPFYRSNEDSVQWVGDSIWSYKTCFDKDDFKPYNNVKLVFDGLDTYTRIFINGKQIFIDDSPDTRDYDFSTDNMFRTWTFSLPENLKEKDNELVVSFFPPAVVDSIKASKLPYTLPDTRAFTRKAQYHSGWDWGPKLVTCGMWKPVYFECWNDFKVSDCQIFQQSLSDSLAMIDVVLAIESDSTRNSDVAYCINGVEVRKDNVELQKGVNHISTSLKINAPQLWWPNGLGEQTLYDVTAIVGDNPKATVNKRIGLREIRLVTDKDEYGSKFEFHVNGIPVFAKGANYIPSDSFVTRKTKDSHREMINSCREANMNMIRIWGGGIYEDDEFYDACDEAGIIVWQDFMFACALYPGDKEFLANVKEEAVQQVNRLRNHPCLALWCGNNEVKNGWEDWGWQNAYTPQQRDEIYAAYNQVFLNILPSVIDSLDTDRPYHASSPLWGWGHEECCTEGDSHYWGVWWGEQPFEVWEAKTGRFMSEYGFQSYPEMATIEAFTIETDRDINSPVMKSHQKHGRGVEIINAYMDNYYGIPASFEDYLYVSQLVQAYGIGKAIEIHRLKEPYCMGTLYWQLNDCWPVASWSSRDYFGRWKALHYEAKHKFENVIIATRMQSDTVCVYVVSDKLADIHGRLLVQVYDFEGNLLRKDEASKCTAKANTSTMLCYYPVRKDFQQRASELFVKFTFTYEDGEVYKLFYLTKPKEMKLPATDISLVAEKAKDYYTINLKSDVLSKDVYISADCDGKYSDNYFDMFPGMEKQVIFIPADKKIKPQFKIKTYSDVF